MARISGVDLPRDKRVEIGLTYIYGIGRKTATDILAATGVDPDIRVRDLSEADVAKLRDYIDHNIKVEGDLRRETSMNIKRLIEIGCYRGVRHRKGLPVRGQSTKAERPHPQGSQASGWRQEEIREVNAKWQQQKVRSRKRVPANAAKRRT